ncbi:hypothetical protein SNEBB_007989 [Seison nebaliae]|nr:hypothetical protein SNEBB_007989 [Seison nebaliae]
MAPASDIDKKLKEVFLFYDTHQHGYVSTTQAVEALRAAGKVPSNDEIQNIIKSVGNRGDRITFSQFTSIAKELPDGESRINELIDAFKTFDVDGTGKISAQELKHALTSLGEPLPHEDVEMFIREANIDARGLFDYSTIVNNIVKEISQLNATSSSTANHHHHQTAQQQSSSQAMSHGARRIV